MAEKLIKNPNDYWLKKIKKELEGEKIKEVRLATDEECKNIGAEYNRPYLICFESNKVMWATSDDEGNDIGVLVVYDEKRRGKYKDEVYPRLSIN